jgi:HNH endonuclease
VGTHQPNRRERMDLILERDGPWCVWCSAPLDASPGALNPPTTEHMVPRIKGGPSWIENELAACRRCNNERGHQTLAGWLQDCRGLGRTPRTDVVIAGLERLQAAITERGGLRRARPYIASQLRRLRRM